MDRRRCEEGQAVQRGLLRPGRGAREIGVGQSSVMGETGCGRLDQFQGVGKAQIRWRRNRVAAETAFKDERLVLPMVEIAPGQKQQPDREGGTPGGRERPDQGAGEVKILLGIIEDEEKTFCLADLDPQRLGRV
jgi:hypothetical protein